MPYCPHCGEEVHEDDRFCIECGTELDRERGGESSYGWQSEPPADGVVDPESKSSSGQTAELTAGRLWVPFGVALFGVVQSVVLVIYPDAVLDSFESFDLQADISRELIVSAGAFGLVSALALMGLVGYYYRQGGLDRRYFWGLVGIGIFGFLLGNNLLFLLPLGIGVYGLYAVL
jgi:hypothetical protein